MLINLLDQPEDLSSEEEWTETLLCGESVRMERIISTGQTSPAGFWYDQEEDEWVTVLKGKAVLEFADGKTQALSAGDCLLLPAGLRHRVAFTSSLPPCVWLCLFGRLRGAKP